MGIDINWLREDKGGNPDEVRESERKRFRDPKVVDDIIATDNSWRQELYQMESMKKTMNDINKAIGKKKKDNKDDPCEAEMAEVATVKANIAEQEKKVDVIAGQRDSLLHKIGNLVHPSVPVSDNEDNNQVVRRWGVPSRVVFDGKTPGRLYHHQVLAKLCGYEPERGALCAGHRGYFMRGAGVMLNMALINYGVQFLIKKGYLPLYPPFFMKKDVMNETAELKDFEETLYRIPGKQSGEKESDGTPDMFLIATSEQPISAFHRGDWLRPDECPKRYAGVSTCFRKEAGSSGKDMWGIFRVHQFEKVEQFCITSPEESWAMHEEMIGIAEEFYQSLELPYQVIAIVSGALNDAAAKKYDLEAWFPGYETYRELVSCSNCTDYQARQLEVRHGQKKSGEREKKYCHMLNATLVASQRTMCCILENYQTPTGVRVPRVLIPYMGGEEFLPFPEEAPAAAGKDKDKDKEGKKESIKDKPEQNGG